MTCALRYFDYRSFDAYQPNATTLVGLRNRYVLGELTRIQPIQVQECHLYHWRNSDRKEFNIFAESPDKTVGFEIRASTSVSGLDIRHLKWLLTVGPGKNRKLSGIVLNYGRRSN